MARSPITASKEGDVTSANEEFETLQFDDDNLKGEAHYAVSLSCRQRTTFAQLTPLPIYLSGYKGNNIEFKSFYSKFGSKDMLTFRYVIFY